MKGDPHTERTQGGRLYGLPFLLYATGKDSKV